MVQAMTNRPGTAKGIETGSSCHCLKQTEAAKGTTSKQQPQRVDARCEHQHGRSDRHSRCLPIRIGGSRGHNTAGDGETGNHRRETLSYDWLPARMAKAMLEPVSAEIDQARWPEGGACCRDRTRKTPNFPADKTHHQDHVGARQSL